MSNPTKERRLTSIRGRRAVVLLAGIVAVIGCVVFFLRPKPSPEVRRVQELLAQAKEPRMMRMFMWLCEHDDIPGFRPLSVWMGDHASWWNNERHLDRFDLIDELVAIGSPGVPALCDALGDPFLSRAAVHSLMLIGDTNAIAPLASVLEDADEGLMSLAGEALRVFGHAARPAWAKALQNTNVLVRSAAVRAFRDLPMSPVTVDTLCSMFLRETDTRVRQEMVHALGNTDDKRAFRLIRSTFSDTNLVREAVLTLAYADSTNGVNELLSAFEEGTLQVRQAAAYGLVCAGIQNAAIIPVLTNALATTENEARGRAAYCLARIGDESILSLLGRFVDSADADSCESIAYGLKENDHPDALRFLAQLATHQDPTVRRFAIEGLRDRKDPLVVSIYKNALSDTNYFVRSSELWALKDFDHPVVTEVFIQALKSEDANIRRPVADFLGEHRGYNVVDALIAALDDGDSVVREYAAKSLGKIGDPRAIPALQKALQKERNCSIRAVLVNLGRGEVLAQLKADLVDPDPVKVLSAVDTAGETGDPQFVPLLVPLLENRDLVDSVIDSLGKIKAPDVISAMVPFLKDESVDRREQTVWALRRTQDKRAIPHLGVALTDRYYRVRRSAVAALGRWGDPAVIPLLRRALRDSCYEVRDEAVRCLANMAGPEVIPDIQEAIERGGESVWWEGPRAIQEIRERTVAQKKE